MEDLTAVPCPIHHLLAAQQRAICDAEICGPSHLSDHGESQDRHNRPTAVAVPEETAVGPAMDGPGPANDRGHCQSGAGSRQSLCLYVCFTMRFTRCSLVLAQVCERKRLWALPSTSQMDF